MNIIAQEARFRQRVVKFSEKKGVTEASRRFHISRQAIPIFATRKKRNPKKIRHLGHVF